MSRSLGSAGLAWAVHLEVGMTTCGGLFENYMEVITSGRIS